MGRVSPVSRPRHSRSRRAESGWRVVAAWSGLSLRARASGARGIKTHARRAAIARGADEGTLDPRRLHVLSHMGGKRNRTATRGLAVIGAAAAEGSTPLLAPAPVLLERPCGHGKPAVTASAFKQTVNGSRCAIRGPDPAGVHARHHPGQHLFEAWNAYCWRGTLHTQMSCQ